MKTFNSGRINGSYQMNGRRFFDFWQIKESSGGGVLAPRSGVIPSVVERFAVYLRTI